MLPLSLNTELQKNEAKEAHVQAQAEKLKKLNETLPQNKN